MANGREGRKSALLIGINQYDSDNPDVLDLNGAISDVTATERFLTEAIPSITITKLTSPTTSPTTSPDGSFPSLAGIRSAFDLLINDANQGDFIYIHFSGHGTRLPTKFRHLKGDNTSYDECLVLARTDHKVDYLRDVEMAFLLKRIAGKGATVTVVLDCCHSGGATRGDGDERVRGFEDAPPDSFFDYDRDFIAPVADLEAAWGRPPVCYDGAGRGGTVVQHWMTASERINFLAACLPKQKAWEIRLGDEGKTGLLTDCLRRVFEETRREKYLDHLSCDAVYNLVSYKVKEYVTKNNKEQDVVFGGQGDRGIFGVESMVQPPVAVTKVEKLPRGRVGVVLSAGLAHGVRSDDIFAIYPSDRPLTSLADYSSLLATCRVRKVDTFTSVAAVQSSKDANLAQVTDGCVAVGLHKILESYVLQPKGVSVLPAKNSAETFKTVVDRVRDSISSMSGSKLLKLEDSSEAFFKVLVCGDDKFTISFTPNQAEATVDVVGEAEILPHLIHLTIFYNLFGLANARQESGLTVRKIGYLDDALPEPQRDDLPVPWEKDLIKIPEDSIDIFNGQSLGIQVRNTSLEDLYVEILDLEPSWAVTRVYPMPKQSRILIPPSEGTYFFIRMKLSEDVPNSKQPDTFDRFVVVATTRERVNFPRDILPVLNHRTPPHDGGDSHPPPILQPDNGDDGRGGDGVASLGWFVQQLDVRVVEEEY
ncbi:caspase domain-containing protein [Chaetomium sp. MPI-CAGE-AT-0009]|nr:caspase domain-containing protein [Chaetomium sp. MPI-CAGE-AT-0009]